MDILNLGCGNRLLSAKPGEVAVNHDRIKHRPEIDAVWDLNEIPWPVEDNSFDRIVARSVFEHIKPDLLETLNECWRILRPEGTIQIKVPYWRADAAYEDPTHRWFFTLGSFDLFDPDTERGQQYGFYTERKWRIVRPARLNNAKTSIFVDLQVRK